MSRTLSLAMLTILLWAYGTWQFKLGDPNHVEYVWGEVVSGNYFDVLGVRADKGRTFIAEEDVTPGTHPVVVVGQGALAHSRIHPTPS